MKKICKICKEEKPPTQFSKNSKYPKWDAPCKECTNKKNKVARDKFWAKYRVVRDTVDYFDRDIGLDPLKIILCKYCRCEINNVNTERYLLLKGYCSEWCCEIENPPKIFHYCPCGNAVDCYRYKSGKNKGMKSGMFPKYCEECIKVGKHKYRGGSKKLNAIT